MSVPMSDLLSRAEAGEVGALARLITAVENRSPGVADLLPDLYRKGGNARVIGVTGSPGAGKSTLVDRLATRYARDGAKVGVVAVDPSSPYTGGAILGDRIRMAPPLRSDNIFIRSMATRGRLGGVAEATSDVVTVLDAAGRDPIIVETVGAGQDEVEIVRLAEVSVVVLVPGMGDDVQALKAGIMEIGDVFVINKCDRPGAEQLERGLRAMLALDTDAHPDRQAPIVRTVATRNEGTGDLVAAIDTVFRDGAGQDSRARRKRRAAEARLRTMLEERLVRTALERVFSNGEFDTVVDAIARRDRDPYSVVEEIVRKVGLGAEP